MRAFEVDICMRLFVCFAFLFALLLFTFSLLPVLFVLGIELNEAIL